METAVAVIVECRGWLCEEARGVVAGDAGSSWVGAGIVSHLPKITLFWPFISISFCRSGTQEGFFSLVSFTVNNEVVGPAAVAVVM